MTAMGKTGKSELLVAALQNGTVIDHIPSDKVFDVVNLLGLTSIDNPITIGSNLSSRKMGSKGIIKIADRYLSDEEIGRLSVVSPDVTLNIIKDYQIVEKKYVKYPKQIIGVVKCTNPKCVTNHQPIPTKMEVFDMNQKSLRCIYCERVMQYGEIELL